MLAWIPLMTDLIHSVGFKPSLTVLGQKRQVKTLTLLHGRPQRQWSAT